MALRLIEFIAPAVRENPLLELPNDQEVLGRWDDRLEGDLILVRVLVRAEQAESMLDELEDRYSDVDGFRVMILPVEATLPRPPESESEAAANKKSPERISREELYHDVAQSATISRVFVAQVILATLVAAVGLIRNDTAVLIGAMVIAPLLGPNVSLCLATTLGDLELALRSLKANVVGLAVAFGTSLLIGVVFTIDPNNEAITSRTVVSGGDIILALSAGCAGVLAFTAGAPSALIGVMVAVALLPPFAAFGLLLATGEFSAASGALLLVATNVICVNLSGVLTFVVQGVRPRSWWKSNERQRRHGSR
ncbi:MAG TPA: TIGR00341 family protein, partial [Pirellulaceae bacterium]|nr:TIGR00341 family protein [Pirellulaceae bacterium]